MKELTNKKAHAEIDFSINLRVTYDDVHDEPVTVEDREALDFLGKIGYDEIVMEKIWGAIKDDSYWGMFDVEYETGCWVSVDWDLDGNTIDIYSEDFDNYIELPLSEWWVEFESIFGSDIDYFSSGSDNHCFMSWYWEEEIDLDYYPDILDEIEKAGA